MASTNVVFFLFSDKVTLAECQALMLFFLVFRQSNVGWMAIVMGTYITRMYGNA